MKGTKKISLVNDCAPELILHTDYHRLKRIILNLLTNALKYTSEGFIVVHASLTSDDSSVVAIQVRDSGVGIDAEAQIKLFKEFNTNVETNKGASKSVVNRDGIGLGLSTSLGLVEKLGPHRKINVKSAKGKGSEFSFLIYNDYSKSSVDRRNRSSSRLSFEKPKIDSKPRISVLEQIFNSKERPLSIGKHTTQVMSLSLGSKLQESKPRHNSRSKIEVNSWAKDSSNRKKLNILIVEGGSLQIHEMRATLQRIFRACAEELCLSFHYNEKLKNCFEDIMNFEDRKQSHLHFVVIAIERSTPSEMQKQISELIIKTVSYWGDRKYSKGQILLINNTGASLKQYLGLDSAEGPMLSQLQVFSGYPGDRQLRKFVSLWTKKHLTDNKE